MNCLWETTEDGLALRCGRKKCGNIYRGPHVADPSRVHGLCKGERPGDFLHDEILQWVGEGPTRECACTDRIEKMNRWGPEECRNRIDEIVGWLVEEAEKRGWWRFAVAVPGSRYFIQRMVLGAIKKAEKEVA